MPVACICPLASGEIRTDFRAGGRTRALQRSIVFASVIFFPVGQKYVRCVPEIFLVIPGLSSVV